MLLILVSGCARQESEEDVVPPPATTTATAPVEEDYSHLPPPVVAPVKLEVTLSPKAQAELSKLSEGIVVEAVYAGDPVPAASTQTNEFGLLDLGKATKELKGPGTVTLAEDVIDRSKLDLIVGQPQIMLNVRSARKATPNNILACKFYWESVATASKQTVQIPCTLLSEAPAE
ncbi:hypothetical protein [Aerolutibacter ruishenii]|nr:hypothetical protein [Lysobacter ruishenii]